MHYENEGAPSSVFTAAEVDKVFSTHQNLIIGTQMVLETSAIFNQLTKLIAREYFVSTSLTSLCRQYIVLDDISNRLLVFKR
jgi:hypothetical protein